MNKSIPWDLLISHLKKETTPEDERNLSEWRADNNETLYNEIISLWENIITDSVSYNPDTNFYWEQIKARMEVTGRKKHLLYRCVLYK